MLDDHAPTDGVAGGGAVSPFEQQQQQQQQHQQQRQHRQQHCPPNARRGGPGPYAQPSPRFQSRPQWADVRPWQKYDDADSAANTLGHHAQQPRPFRMQKTPPPGHSGSRRPVLELRSDAHIPPDLISPRSDSFFYGSSRPPRPCPSPTPTISHFQPVNRTRAESTPTQRPPRSAFPGLSSNPFIPESPESEDTSPVETRRFPLLSRQHEQLNRSESDSNMGSPIESRQSTPTEPSVVVENFSRPRKTSVRSQQSDGALSRRMAAHRLHAEPPQHNQPPPPPTGTSQPPAATTFGPAPNSHPPSRRPSASSSKTSSTFSSNPPHPNNEFFNPPPPKSDSSRQPTPAVIAPPPASHQRPPPALYNNNSSHAHLREAPAWLTTGDELRSSFRSQLTSSSGQGTVFTTHGTDRNSVITKASSVTEQSIINGYARRSWRATSVDDGPSLEDVMGMYERGFNDSDIESVRRSMRFTEDDDIPETDADVEMPGMGTSRPASSHSGASELRAKVLEAMNDSLPNPKAFQVSEPASSTARQSRNRRSLFPNSVPNSIGLGLASEHASRRERAESDTTDKHDSAKMLDGDGGPVLPEDAGSQPPTTASPTSTAQVQPSSMADLPTVRTATPGAMPRLPQEPPEEPGSRDRYGFRKASANVTRQEYDAWDSNYSAYLARRRRKWIAFLKDNSLMTDRPNRFPPRSAKTKRFIRKGIPPDWRGAAWFYYAGGPAILSNNRGVYDQLVRRAGLEQSDPNTPPRTSELKPLIVDDIEKDLYRTFPDNVRFKPPPLPGQPQPPPEPEIITSLRRVLHAFALYNPRIGYCQSLNFLAGLLLLFVETEEQAFWLLNVITRVYLPGTHEMSLEGSKVDLGVLMIALKDSMPSVWKQIGGDELEAGKKHKGRRGQKFGHGGNSGSISDPNRLPAITLCMTAWFMSCFIGTLPIETVLRVWDVFFYEGSRTLFRIALTIFKLGEREIKAVKDPMEMFGVVQTFPRRMVDCNMLLETCYKRRNGIAHLSQEVVEEKRQERREGIRRWKAEQEAAASQDNSPQPTTKHRFGAAALGLDLATDLDEVRRKATLFGRRKDRAEQTRATEVV